MNIYYCTYELKITEAGTDHLVDKQSKFAEIINTLSHLLTLRPFKVTVNLVIRDSAAFHHGIKNKEISKNNQLNWVVLPADEAGSCSLAAGSTAILVLFSGEDG